MTAAVAVPTVAPAPWTDPWWRDPRFLVPAAFVGLTVAATGMFAAVHFMTRSRRSSTTEEPVRTAAGFVFPERGYVLCPQALGLRPTPKTPRPGSFVVLWLGDPEGNFVEATWGRILKVDDADPQRIFVILAGEETPVGQRPLRTEKHGFNLSQVFWMTKDCLVDLLDPLEDPNGALLCGAQLVVFDGPDDDFEPDGFQPAPPPAPPRQLVGRDVDLLLVSKAGKGSAWQVPVRATIVDVGPSGDLATVKVKSVQANTFADDPQMGHQLKPGDEFDVVWDCITAYHPSLVRS